MIVEFISILTIEPHDLLEGFHVGDLALVPSEDLGPGGQLVGHALPDPAQVRWISADVVDLFIEWHVVGWPVACDKTVEFLIYLTDHNLTITSSCK